MRTNRLRLTLTALLAATLWMPAYTCAGYQDPAGKVVTMIPSGADSSAYTPVRIPHVPIREADLGDAADWLRLWPYWWAIPVAALALWRPTSLVPDIATVVIAPLGTLLVGFHIWERIAYGTYIAQVASLGLWLLAVLSLIGRWRARRRRPAVAELS